MKDTNIKALAQTFKDAIMVAKDNNEFDGDILFHHFPRGCCGDTCYLLGEFLKEYGIRTVYVCGVLGEQSHAWLVVKDKKIEAPVKYQDAIPDDVLEWYNLYSGDKLDPVVSYEQYEERNLINGSIVDITGDQFGEVSVYVGDMDLFHRRFEFSFAHDYIGFETTRLRYIYDKVLEYIA